MDTKEKPKASKHVSAMLYPSQTQSTIADLSSTRGDGLCIVEEDPKHSNTSMGARIINPYRLDIRIEKNWLSS